MPKKKTFAKSAAEKAAYDWAEKRAGKRKALIAFSDIYDAFMAGYKLALPTVAELAFVMSEFDRIRAEIKDIRKELTNRKRKS